MPVDVEVLLPGNTLTVRLWLCLTLVQLLLVVTKNFPPTTRLAVLGTIQFVSGKQASGGELPPRVLVPASLRVVLGATAELLQVFVRV